MRSHLIKIRAGDLARAYGSTVAEDGSLEWPDRIFQVVQDDILHELVVAGWLHLDGYHRLGAEYRRRPNGEYADICP